MLVCKNCENNFEGKFCPNCGQRVIDKRFNLKDSFSWLFNSIFNLDHGFLHTTRDLFVKPGTVIRRVLNGATVDYTHPFRLLFIWATISTVLVLVLGTYDEQTNEMYNNMEFSEQQLAIQQKINVWIKKYLNFIILANVPFISLFSRLLYKKKKLNFTEHMVINSYGYVLATTVGIVITIIQYFTHQATLMMVLGMSANILLMAYVYKSTFNENYFYSILKYFFSFLFSYLLIMVSFAIAGLVIAIASKVFGFDVFNSSKEAQIMLFNQDFMSNAFSFKS